MPLPVPFRPYCKIYTLRQTFSTCCDRLVSENRRHLLFVFVWKIDLIRIIQNRHKSLRRWGWAIHSVVICCSFCAYFRHECNLKQSHCVHAQPIRWTMGRMNDSDLFPDDKRAPRFVYLTQMAHLSMLSQLKFSIFFASLKLMFFTQIKHIQTEKSVIRKKKYEIEWCSRPSALYHVNLVIEKHWPCEMQWRPQNFHFTRQKFVIFHLFMLIKEIETNRNGR